MEDKYAIKITTPQNPLRCHNMLTDVKKGKMEFTPDFAQSFLQSTNNRKNIAVFLELISDKLQTTPSEYAQYKPYIMALVCKREQPVQIKQTIAELALKYTSLKTADKTDRDFFALLSKVDLPEQQAKQVRNLSDKIYEIIPVDVNDIAADVTKKIIVENENCTKISQYVVRELPEKTNTFIRKRWIKKMRKR